MARASPNRKPESHKPRQQPLPWRGVMRPYLGDRCNQPVKLFGRNGPATHQGLPLGQSSAFRYSGPWRVSPSSPPSERGLHVPQVAGYGGVFHDGLADPLIAFDNLSGLA